MFGMTMQINQVTLRAFSQSDIAILATHFSSMKIHMHTMGLFAQTLENETEWYEKNRQDPKGVTWAIQPEGEDEPIGVTSLNNIDVFGSCTSGIIIWRPDWWGKRIASNAHLARTLFAADFLNRFTIKSFVRVQNPASLKAVQNVGYHVTGVEPRTHFRQGKFVDTHTLCWINPDRVDTLFPDGTPNEYRPALKKASAALQTARELVTFP